MEQYANGQQQPSPAQQQQQANPHFQAKMAQQSALGLGYPGSPGGSQAASPVSAKPFPQQQQQQQQQRAAFMNSLLEHLARKGTPITAPVIVDTKQIDLFRLFSRAFIHKSR